MTFAVLLYLLALPPSSSSWSGEQRRAFCSLLGAISSLGSPRLMPSLFVDILPDVSRVAVYRRYLPHGSLRDYIHRALEPLQPHSNKYGRAGFDTAFASASPAGHSSFSASWGSFSNRRPSFENGSDRTRPEPATAAAAAAAAAASAKAVSSAAVRRARAAAGPSPLPPEMIRRFGREILEGLATLSALGIPFPHLHAGNILIDVGGEGQPTARLAEYELAVLGAVTSRAPLGQRPPSAPPLSEEVVRFGHVLHEMLTGRELTPVALEALKLRFAAHMAAQPSASEAAAGGAASGAASGASNGAAMASPPPKSALHPLAGPPEAWDVVRSIFLPEAHDGARPIPTLTSLLALPLFATTSRDEALAATANCAASLLAASMAAPQRALLASARSTHPDSIASEPPSAESAAAVKDSEAAPSTNQGEDGDSRDGSLSSSGVSVRSVRNGRANGDASSARLVSSSVPAAATAAAAAVALAMTAPVASAEQSQSQAEDPDALPLEIGDFAADATAGSVAVGAHGEMIAAPASPIDAVEATKVAAAVAKKALEEAEAKHDRLEAEAKEKAAAKAAAAVAKAEAEAEAEAEVEAEAAREAARMASEEVAARNLAASKAVDVAATEKSATVPGHVAPHTPPPPPPPAAVPQPARGHTRQASDGSADVHQAALASSGSAAAPRGASGLGPRSPTRNHSSPSLTKEEAAQVEIAISKLPNKNRPSEYRWMETLLSLIALNAAPTVHDLQTHATGSPLFVMAGACPSVFAGMQTVVFTSMRPADAPPAGLPSSGTAVQGAVIDFWWLKPAKDDPSALEQETLNRHFTGPNKNDPGASRKVYAPISQLFTSGKSTDGKLLFGVVHAGNNAAPRAYIECVESGARYYLCWVWLEDWSSPVSVACSQSNPPSSHPAARPSRHPQSIAAHPLTCSPRLDRRCPSAKSS